MALLALTAGQLFTPLEAIPNGVVIVDDGVIRAAGPRESVKIPKSARTVQLGNKIIAPGFVDIHIHGGAGHDLMEGTCDAIEAVARSTVEHGTTSFVATTLSAPEEGLRRSRAGLSSVVASWNEKNRDACGDSGDLKAEPLGIHMEGPFISAARRGAHPLADLSTPSNVMFQELFAAAGDSLRILTLAPELEGALELQEFAAGKGVRVAIGHSNATYEQAMRAIDAGAVHAVHVFNAMRPFSHRDPGILGAVLTDDRVSTEVIADGVHVDAAALRLLVRAKGARPKGAGGGDGRIVLVTDAVSATGMSPGQYSLGEMEIILGDDPHTGLPCCRNREGALAGSVLTQDQAVRNMVSLAGVTLQEAVSMASYNPARLVGIEGRKGWLQEGADADLVILESNGAVAGVMAQGRANFL